jgi:uncharacterized protein
MVQIKKSEFWQIDADLRFGFGQIWHQRSRPKDHEFRYRAFFVALPAHVLLGPARGSWLFGINRRALISVSMSDHRMDAQESLAKSLPTLFENEQVTLFCFAKILGYQFKPVSFWLSEQKVLAEVHNTFGERHAYLLPREGPLEAEKRFHVSPFCDVKGRYTFEIQALPGHFSAAIHYFDVEGLPALIKTRMGGKLVPVNVRSILRALFGYPFFSLAVIAGIHWHALRLWIKKVPWFSKPAPPLNSLTHAINFTPKND